MAHEPMTPEWFHHELYKQLVARQAEIEFFDAYYTGDHPLPWLAEQARDEFRRLVRMTRSNYMGLVCDATAERASVEGFRLRGEDDANEDAWAIWQANDLDADSDKAWLESLIGGTAYFMVAPNRTDPTRPNIWVEHGSQVIVAYEPGTNRRVRKASLKVWDDEWTGEIHSTLYLREGDQLFLYKHKARRQPGSVGLSVQPTWERREVPGETWPAPGGMAEVPHIEIPNNPRLLTGGISELYDLTDIQDRINKTLFDRMQTQEFGVDPQKWAKAFPNEDEDGNPNTVEFGRNRMITTDIAETGFGNFAVAPLTPYLEAKREDVKDIASRSRTPAQYLLGEMSNVNGETLKASESGLISKVIERTRHWGQAAEQAMAMALRLAGSSVDASAMETIWRDPQYRTEGERTDAAIKRYAGGVVPLRQTREDLGYSQVQIDRMEAADTAAAADPIAEALLRDAGVIGSDTGA